MPDLRGSTPAKTPPLVRLGLEDRLRDRIAQEIQTGRLRIPPLPRLALELQRLARSPVADLGEAVQLVKRDAQLTALVLRMASSAAYRRAGGPALASIEQAAVLIGIKGLRDVAFTASIGQAFSCGPLDERMRETQRHSFAVACGAAYGCALLELDTDDGFLCGLLHDVGRQLILATLALLGSRHSSWLAEDVVRDPYLSLHQELGAVVIAHWELDGPAAEVAACHHAPERAAAAPQLTLLVALADAGDHLEAPDAATRGELLAEHPLARESGLGREEAANLGELLEAVRHDSRINRITG